MAAALIAAQYDEPVRRTYGVGPERDLLVCACPDGRMVVIDADGNRLADSRDPSLQSQAILRGLEDS